MNDHQIECLKATEIFVKQELEHAEGGHDWWHIYRVRENARKINATENSDAFVVELAVLLHDIADSKFHGGDETIGPEKARAFLETLALNPSLVNHVVNIIANMSFKNSFDNVEFSSIELSIVQDADKLDAIGAIGIARAFNYGGYKNRAIYDPNIKPNLNLSKEEYKKSTAPTINHFYEKLLLLKDMMKTQSGKKLALERHQFMLDYLKQFYQEWNEQ